MTLDLLRSVTCLQAPSTFVRCFETLHRNFLQGRSSCFNDRPYLKSSARLSLSSSDGYSSIRGYSCRRRPVFIEVKIVSMADLVVKYLPHVSHRLEI